MRLARTIGLAAAACALGGFAMTASASAAVLGVGSAQRTGLGSTAATGFVFAAGGSTTAGLGTYLYRESSGYTVTGRVTCYHQETALSGGRRAVISGPVLTERNPDLNTPAFTFLIADDNPVLPFGGDAFQVFSGGNEGSACATNNPLSLFDDPEFQPDLLYVTRGSITIR
jgi:hypothetical protein